MALPGYTVDFLQTANFYSKISRIHRKRLCFFDRQYGCGVQFL